MALGVPFGLERIGRRLLRNDKTQSLAIRSYRAYLKRYLITEYYWNQYLGDGKLLHPYTIIEVDPDRIKKKMPKGENFYKEDRFRSRIEDGDWDKRAEDFKGSIRYNSIKERYNQNKDWEETLLYKKGVKSIENNKKRFTYGCNNKEELKERLSKIDKLHSQIESDGYKRQSEIKDRFKIRRDKNIDSYTGELNEVLVNIGRNGELIIDEGFHRTSIAKILDLEKIPVRIIAIHPKYRDKVKGG